MFIFDKGSRVQKVTEGVQFYEPDILCSSYLFSGDLEINIVIDYERPGFGVVLIECDEREPDKMNNYSNLYLGKLGAVVVLGSCKGYNSNVVGNAH